MNFFNERNLHRYGAPGTWQRIIIPSFWILITVKVGRKTKLCSYLSVLGVCTFENTQGNTKEKRKRQEIVRSREPLVPVFEIWPWYKHLFWQNTFTVTLLSIQFYTVRYAFLHLPRQLIRLLSIYSFSFLFSF